MIVRINILDRNLEETNTNFIFTDSTQFLMDNGYNNLNNCYPCFVNDTLNFHLTNISGLFDNLPLESYSEIGVGDIGNTWRGNYGGSKVITLTFDNVFQQKGDFSPNEILATYVNNPSQYVKLGVNINNKEYQLICHFTGETHLENQTLVLESAFSGEGTFWNGGLITKTYYIWQMVPAMPKSIPFEVQSDTNYPLEEQLLTAASQAVYFSIEGKTNGDWKSVRLFLGETELYCERGTNNKLIIDSDNELITDENGNDLTDDIDLVSGGNKLLFTRPGINSLKVIINENYEDIEDFENLATDTLVIIKYEDLKNSIGVASECK